LFSLFATLGPSVSASLSLNYYVVRGLGKLSIQLFELFLIHKLTHFIIIVKLIFMIRPAAAIIVWVMLMLDTESQIVFSSMVPTLLDETVLLSATSDSLDLICLGSLGTWYNLRMLIEYRGIMINLCQVLILFIGDKLG
jgi:hypothetical protein